MDNIQVGIRVRPLIDRELEGGNIQWMVNGNTILQKHSSTHSYIFDHVFSSSTETDVIYETLAKPIILSVMEGFNGTIFAYGQTSSGKTHTMMGGLHHVGIIPLSIGGIFNYIEQHPEREFIICTSYLEIYNETLTDLLSPTNKELRIREDTEHNVRVHGLTVQAVTEAMDIARLLNMGENNRSVGETNMNDRSSRSHTIFTLTIESRLRDEEGGDGTVKVASLNLVDLAGSERVSATGAEGIRFKEGTFINMSLLVLGNVISKLSEGTNAHIPFRDSKLTRILQPSLGGNAKTCIICTVTPAEVGETHSTLKFASRAKTIKNKPVVNEVLVGEEALLKKLKTSEKENEKLRKRLEDGLPEQERQQLTEQLEQKEREKTDLENRMKALQDIIVKSSVAGNDTIPLGRTKAARRQTVCPSLLSRDVAPCNSPAIHVPRTVFAVPKIHATPTASAFTPLMHKRVTFAGSPVLVSPFQPKFDRQSFEKHLQDMQYIASPLVINRSKACRPSFIPRISTTPASISEDSLDSTGISQTCVDYPVQMIDAQVQTDNYDDMPQVDADCQTSLPLPSPSPIHILKKSCSGRTGLNDSLCVHKQETNQAKERIDMMAFEAEENMIKFQEMQQQLTEAEEALALKEVAHSKAEAKASDMVMACQAQEELLLSLQEQLKQANTKIHASREETFSLQQQLEATQTISGREVSTSIDSEEFQLLKCELDKTKAEAKSHEEMLTTLRTQLKEADSKFETTRAQFDEERFGFSQEISDLKTQLESLEKKLQGTPSANKKNPTMSTPIAVSDREIEQLKTKLEESEANRRTEEKEFQRMYQVKVHEAHRLNEKVCALEEEVENLLMQQGQEMVDNYSAVVSEESLDEKAVVIDRLTEKCTSLEDEFKRVYNEYEAYAATSETKIKELEQKLTSITEAQEVFFSDKEREMESAKVRWEEMVVNKQNECQLLQKTVDELNCEMTALKSQLEDKRSLLSSKEVRLSELEASLDAAQRECAEAQTALLRANKAKETVLDDREREIGSERVKWEELVLSKQSELQALQKNFDELRCEMSAVNRQLEDKTYLLSSRDIRVSDLEASLSTAHVRVSELEASLSTAHVHVSELEASLSMAHVRVSELEASLSMAHARVSELEASLAEAQKDCASMEAALHVSKKDNNEISSQLSQQKRNIHELESALNLAQEEYNDAQELLQFTEKERNEAQWNLKEADDKCYALQEEIETLKKKLSEISGEAQVLQALREQVEQLKDQNSEYCKLQSELSELQEDYSDMKELFDIADKERNEAMYCEEELQRKFDDLEHKYEQLKKQVKADSEKVNEDAVLFKEELQKKCYTLQDRVQQLDAELKCVRASETELQRTVTAQREQLAEVTSKKAESRQETSTDELEEMLKAVRKENARLIAKIQGMASVPDPTAVAEPVVDGSGAVTGLAFYRLQQDKLIVDREYESLKNKFQRLRSEYTLEKERHSKEKEESKRYRHERNIFRTKYQTIKDNCSCGVVEKYRNDPSVLLNSNSSKQDPSHNSPERPSNPVCLKHLPSPHPGRKSVLSFKVPPVSNTAYQRRAPLPEAKPMASGPVMKRSDREEMSSRDAPRGGFKDLWSDEIENIQPNYDAASEKKPQYFWERTFMEAHEEDNDLYGDTQ